MSGHHQAAKPAGLDLAEEVTLPNGRHCAGTKARVYDLLRWTAETGHRFAIGRHQGPAGWVPTWVLREPWAGGAAGDRRVRDLRAAGVDIEGQPFETGEQGTASWIFRLAAGAGRPPRPEGTSPTAATPRGMAVPLREARPHLDLVFDTGFSWSAAGDMPVCSPRAILPLPPEDAEDRPGLYWAAIADAWRSGHLGASLADVSQVYFLFPPGEDALAEVLERALLRLGARRRVGP